MSIAAPIEGCGVVGGVVLRDCARRRMHVVAERRVIIVSRGLQLDLGFADLRYGRASDSIANIAAEILCAVRAVVQVLIRVSAVGVVEVVRLRPDDVVVDIAALLGAGAGLHGRVDSIGHLPDVGILVMGVVGIGPGVFGACLHHPPRQAPLIG